MSTKSLCDKIHEFLDDKHKRTRRIPFGITTEADERLFE